MADFIGHVIKERRGEAFRERVDELKDTYATALHGRPNDLRIASNFALLGAAFQESSGNLADDWADGAAETREFVELELPEMALTTAGIAEDQQAATVFLDVLSALVDNGRVKLEGHSGRARMSNALVIGRVERRGCDRGPAGAGWPVYLICTIASIEAVQTHLRQAGRPPLTVTPRTLAKQLDEAGALAPARSGKLRTEQRRMPDGKAVRLLPIRAEALALDGRPGPGLVPPAEDV
jgi:hypothetical protein